MATDAAVPSTAELLKLFELASKIKQTDDRMRSLKMGGQLPRLKMMYSPRGQEFVSVGVAAHLTREDYVVTTYRGMADHLAKGVSSRDLWAEFLGKASGTCKGKGGPMHITDVANGVMVTTGIVGGGIPIAVGLGLASKLRGDGRVTVVNFGDGATNIGAFHEALNMASLWELPVVFVCHNNLYAEHTSYAGGTAVDEIATRGLAYRMPGVRVDGNDPLAMYQAGGEAVERARRGGGPTLLEGMTYRFWGHTVGDDMEYMPADERAEAMEADPVPAFRAWLVAEGHASEGALADIEARIDVEIEDARDFASKAPEPDGSDFDTDVYAEVAVR